MAQSRLDRYRALLKQMHQHAARTLGPSAMREWAESLPSDRPRDEVNFWVDVMTFHHKLRGERSISQIYLRRDDAYSGMESAMIVATVTPYSLYRMVAERGAKGYLVRDLLRGREHVVEVEAAPFRPGQAMLAKLVGADPAWIASRHPGLLSSAAAESCARRFLGKRRTVHTSTLLGSRHALRLIDGWHQALTRQAESFEPCSSSVRHSLRYPPERQAWLLAGLRRVPLLLEQTPEFWTFEEGGERLGTLLVEGDGQIVLEASTVDVAERLGAVLVAACGGLVAYDGPLEVPPSLASLVQSKGQLPPGVYRFPPR